MEKRRKRLQNCTQALIAVSGSSPFGCAAYECDYLELWVAQHHQGSAGPGALPVYEGHVQAPDPPQAREGGVPLPGLRVPGHHARLQPGLFPSEAQTSKRAQGPQDSPTLGAAALQSTPISFLPIKPEGRRKALRDPTCGPETRAAPTKAGGYFRQRGGPGQACVAAPVFGFTAVQGL